ncbi:cystathionine gamma-synthase family protein [Hymenobacter rubripertinctus]|uniref:Cystathionine gamma-synthase family protein n=1 Tax=Hymenobacter rubripertinctus TaxID=2029981 RepID=A0A418R098_9BACT|nr:cystathionine gamma-synthase family protein [Hymenobacter rubripertinctus]RIY10821.1 cystathionine gamma-synthase family protein [Hymenobacter rubripertinctus]
MTNPADHACINGQRLNPESLMMSYGYTPAWSEGAIKPPIFQTSTFVFKNAEEGKAFFELAYGLRQQGPDEEMGLIYSRLNNPSLEILENRLTLWDEAEEAASFASGMAAISTTLLALLQPGDVVLHSEPVYGGSDFFLKNVLRKFGIEAVGFRPSASPEEMQAQAAAIAPGRLAMIYVETPANPTNHLIDLDACAALARQYATPDKPVRFVVDNTFLGPVFQHPLKHGADVILYSATKFLGGHSDLIAGAALSSHALMKEIKAMRTFMGTMCDPNTGWMLMRSLETLKLRMERAAQSAQTIADWLRAHPLVERTHYLTHLEGNPVQQDIYRRQCLSPGSMISFDIRGGEAEAFRFLNALKLIKLAVSLGGTESLAEHPGTMTHSDITLEDQKEMGITPQMIRLSIGVEDPQDLMLDLGQAFEAVGMPKEVEVAEMA